jgi:3-carboxy-cis,cis-muconate cycloisomerase
MSSPAIDGVGTTEELGALFSDDSILAALLLVESTAAQVQGRLGLVPARAAAAIQEAAQPREFDVAALARGARDSGTLVVPLVAALRARVASLDPASARFVHWGLTSQDVSDTALVLIVKRARTLLATTQERLERTLRARSDEHARTIMVGRTLLQPAAPITFGLKIAGWYAGIHRSWNRLSHAIDAACVLQCGGAAGTLASFGRDGLTLRRSLADALDLREGDGPWHTERDRLAAMACACGVLIGALGKMARDVSLLMQQEVGEAFEPGGGSSAMPHKRNPAACAIALAAATRAPGLVAAFLTGVVQEHERSVGGWQAEWPTLTSLIQATGAASAALAGVAEGLTVDTGRMRANLDTAGAALFSEQIVMLLVPALGRERAETTVRDAIDRSRRTGAVIADVLKAMPAAADVLTAEQLARIGRPEEYLGSAEALRRELLGSA